MFIKKSKGIDQCFVPVAEIHPNPTKTTITSQNVHVDLRNFVCALRSYNRSCLYKKSKRIDQIFVPVAEIHPNPTKTTITSQKLNVDLRNFVCAFRTCNTSCLLKKAKGLTNFSYL